MSSQAASPICARCRQPIAGTWRKDRFGNCYCESCAQALIGAAARAKQRAAGLRSIQQHPATAPAPTQPAPIAEEEPLPAPAQSVPVSRAATPRPSAGRPAPANSDTAPIIPDLSVPETLTAEGTIALEPESDKPRLHTRQCEKCAKLINAEVSICPYCNYDTRLGPAALTEPLHTCINCGYDLAGLPEPICPECGTVNPKAKKPRGPRAADLEKQSREIARTAYRRTAIMLAAGLLGLLIVTLSFGQAKHLLYFGMGYVVGVPTGLAVYVICCLLWIGFDMPLHLVAFRLAAIYAVVDVLDATGNLLGIFKIIVWPVVYLTYLGLLMEELDLELQDAWILAFLTGIAKALVGAILLVILRQLGVQISF